MAVMSHARRRLAKRRRKLKSGKASGDRLARDRGALTIVTGASGNHYRCLCHLLDSLDYHETAPVVVYDLGLSETQSKALRTAGRHVVRFEFERYPAFFGTQAMKRSPCCWKPPLIRETLEATDGAVLWLDAGNLVHERLDRVRRALAKTGFYSPASTGDIARFTHPQVLAALEAAPDILADRNRNGAIVGFGRNEIGLELSRLWRDCALRQEVIWPHDWTKDRWRSDQAILSVLAAQFHRRHGLELIDTRLGISTQNDRLSDREARRFMKLSPAGGARRALDNWAARRRRPAYRLWRAVKRLLRGKKVATQ